MVGNLELEHYFSDEAMSARVDGLGLKSVAPSATVVVAGIGSVTLPDGESLTLGAEYEAIDSSSKKGFIESVLPTLGPSDYSAFAALFELVETTIAELEVRRLASPETLVASG